MAHKLDVDARWLIEQRVADMEVMKNRAWRAVERQGVYAKRGLLERASRVWRNWHDFSASPWV